jgi:hypothetical protein
MRGMTLHLSLAACLLGVAAFLSTAAPAGAAWSTDPTVNNPVCVITDDQYIGGVVADGAGGVYVAWHDHRAGEAHIYVTRLTQDGVPAPGWPVNGLPVCTVAGGQTYPSVALDGVGGLFVAWEDFRTALNSGIYAQRLTAGGAIASGWPANGVLVAALTGNDNSQRIVADGSGGAYFVWVNSYAAGDLDIIANHLTGTGAVAPGWAAAGLGVDRDANFQVVPVAVSDGAGGMLVAYQSDAVASGTYRAVLSRVPAGPAMVSWRVPDATFGGGAAGAQSSPLLCSDGAGGGFLAWADSRSLTSSDVYVQRFDGAGLPKWSYGGAAFDATVANEYPKDLVADGSGGAMLLDQQVSGSFVLHHLQSAQGEAPGWPAFLSLPTADPGSVAVDGLGGAYVSSSGYELVSTNVRATRVNAAGVTAAGWPYGGASVSAAGGNQLDTHAVSDGAGNAIVVFGDTRNGNLDIYSQRIDRFAALGDATPHLTAVRDVRGDQGGSVRLQWNASPLDQPDPGRVADYRVWRQTPATAALAAQRAGASLLRAEDGAVALEAAIASGQRVYLADVLAAQFAWEYVGTQPASGYPAYSFVSPTTTDSLPGYNPRTVFMVQAHATDGAHWDSAPDSGYSVDDLPPLAPAPFAGIYASGGTSMTWGANAETDLAGYRLYRGHSTGFAPGPASLVSTTSATAYVDPAGAPYVYKLSAVDIHGNESAFATLVPAGTLAVDSPSLPAEVTFGMPSPNPARGGTTLRFGLPRAARVSLGLFDQQGRRLRTLLDGTIEAGEHEARWDGAGADGHPVAPGMYFARFEADGRCFTRRLAAIH